MAAGKYKYRTSIFPLFFSLFVPPPTPKPPIYPHHIRLGGDGDSFVLFFSFARVRGDSKNLKEDKKNELGRRAKARTSIDLIDYFFRNTLQSLGIRCVFMKREMASRIGDVIQVLGFCESSYG